MKRNLIYNLILQLSNILFPLITVPYISRIFGVENLGIVNFVNTYIGYFSLIALLGINFYGVREIAKIQGDRFKINKLFSALFTLVCISTFVTSLIYIVSIFTIPQFVEYWHYYSFAGITLFLSPLSLNWYFSGLEDFRIITLRSVIVRVMCFIALFLFVKERDDIFAYFAIMVSSVVATDIWNVIYAYRRGLRFIWKGLKIRQHFQPMFVFFISNIAISIFVTLDVLMLGFLSNFKEVGYFTAANRIIMIILVAFSAINTVLLPRLSSNMEKDDQFSNKLLLQKAFDVIVFFMFPVALGLCLCSKAFVPLFFGPEFTGSILPMQILAFKLIVVMINSFFSSNILIAFGFESKFVYIVLITALISITLNWLFIPRFGAVGAAVTSVLAEGIEVFLNLYIVYKLTEIRISWNKFFLGIFYLIPIVLLYVFFHAYIQNPYWFLSLFIFSSVLVYSLLHWYWGREQWMIDVVNIIKLKNENIIDL